MLDRVTLLVTGGSGGNGLVSLHREKFVPRGGPDGGDGGRGGRVILRAVDDVYTLEQYRSRARFRAGDGHNGGPKLKSGARGEDLMLLVPAGTVVLDQEMNEVLADLAAAGDEYVAAHGGRGGWGNKRFATSTNQAPLFSQKGGAGEEVRIVLEMRLLADVGLLGLPNAGKSTLLAAVSNAKPKIADYPFTTLEPMLGVVDVGFERFTLADLPGLIEGASEGHGLGFEFLKHIRRCRVLLHLVDGSSPDPVTDLELIRGEVVAYEERLAEVPQVVAVAKADLDPAGAAGKAEILGRHLGISDVAVISAESGAGIPELLERLLAMVREQRAREEEQRAEALPVLRPAPADRFEILPAGPGRWEVEGRRVVGFVEMMDLKMEGAREEVERRLERWGVARELRRLGAQPGDVLVFGETEMEWES